MRLIPKWFVLRLLTTSNAEPACTWKQIIDPVEPFLEAVGQRLAKQVEAFDPDIVRYADYALNGQGKHLRAALVALTAKALGKVNDAHVTVAVIIEMVHLATLVHDDVIDEAEIRRGRPTLAANWSNEIAVLFGDCLFAHALKLAASFPDAGRLPGGGDGDQHGLLRRNPANRSTGGTFSFTREKYFKVLEMKTAELFALSCELSAGLSGTAAEQRMALRQFGLAFGTAYQVYDDCVDLFGSEAAAGKSLGTDLAKGKLTLPVLLLWERADAADRARLRELVEGWQAGSMKRLAGLLAKYDALGASLEIIHQYLDKARQIAAGFARVQRPRGFAGFDRVSGSPGRCAGVCA